MVELGVNRYGKSAIRLVTLERGDQDRVRDLTVAVVLEGDFAAAHVAGDNTRVVTTDGMKNTVYAFAREPGLAGPIEAFGRDLAEHFVALEPVSRATLSIRETAWAPIEAGGRTAPGAFVRTPTLTRTAEVTAEQSGAVRIAAGLEDLTVMKTRGSGFAGFFRDRYTTLPERDDRLLATRIAATWRYQGDGAGVDFDAVFAGVTDDLLAVFADHHSPSVQASIWEMGGAILERHPELEEITMRLPNLHHWLVDLAPFGLDNPDRVFVATSEPHGLIEATVRRAAGGPE